MLQKMSTHELDEERGEGPPDEVGIYEKEEHEKVMGEGGEAEVEQNERQGEESLEVLKGNGVPEIQEGRELEQIETKGLQGTERVEEMQRLKGNGVQEIKVGEVEEMETERQQGEEERVEETEVLEENNVQETSKDDLQVNTILLI